ncbi:MAG TPA: ABC transporter permease [Acetobacteraceae bacterium]|nr:ABC transporter permease [Acetobacteraceae bacterium]
MAPPVRGRLALRLSQFRELGLVASLLALVLATAAVNPRFLSPLGIRDILLDVSVIALVAIGETLALLMRQVDLSVSSILGIAAYGAGAVFVAFPGLPIPVVMLLGVAAGAVLGAMNGLLIAYGRVPSLVATLGTLYVFRGADYAWVKGGQINAINLPPTFRHFANAAILGVPVMVLLVIIVTIGFGYYLRHYPGGREYYAVGSNEEAARLAGINVERRLMRGFMLSGAIAGLAGVLFLARFGTADATAGAGMELRVVAAAVVGGVAITGGVGTVQGAALGALLLGVISNALVVLRVPAFWQQTIEGALLLVAISLDILLARHTLWLMRARHRNG